MSIERPEELDSKKRAFEGYADLEKDEQKAFDTLKLGKPEGNNYSDAEIRDGVMNTLSEGVHQAKLPPDDLKRAEALLQEISTGMTGLSQKEMIEMYSKFRIEIKKILSLDSAKDERPKVENERSETAQKTEEKGRLDFFLDRARDIARMLKEQEMRRKEAQQVALQGVQKKDTQERTISQEGASRELSEWPA